MKVLLVFVLVVATCMALPFRQNKKEDESGGCALFCSFIYTPVCGTDGKINRVFASPCMMERQSCLEQKEYRRVENDSVCDFNGYLTQ